MTSTAAWWRRSGRPSLASKRRSPTRSTGKVPQVAEKGYAASLPPVGSRRSATQVPAVPLLLPVLAESQKVGPQRVLEVDIDRPVAARENLAADVLPVTRLGSGCRPRPLSRGAPWAVAEHRRRVRAGGGPAPTVTLLSTSRRPRRRRPRRRDKLHGRMTFARCLTTTSGAAPPRAQVESGASKRIAKTALVGEPAAEGAESVLVVGVEPGERGVVLHVDFGVRGAGQAAAAAAVDLDRGVGCRRPGAGVRPGRNRAGRRRWWRSLYSRRRRSSPDWAPRSARCGSHGCRERRGRSCRRVARRDLSVRLRCGRDPAAGRPPCTPPRRARCPTAWPCGRHRNAARPGSECSAASRVPNG